MDNNINEKLDELSILLQTKSKENEETRNKFITVVSDITKEYATNLEDVSAVVIGGSIARGLGDNDSDIEMYVYYENIIPNSDKIKAVIKNLNAHMTRSSELLWQHEVWGPHTFFAINDVNIELGYRKFSQIKSKLEKYLIGEDIIPHPTNEADTPFGHYTSGIADCILSSCILFEDDSQKLSQLKQELLEYPDKLQKQIFGHYFNEANMMNKVKLRSSAKRNDGLAFNAQLSSIIRSMSICLFTLNKVHFPGDKWNKEYIEKFKIIPPGYNTFLDRLLNKSNEGSENKCYKYVLVESCLEKIKDLYSHNVGDK